MTKADKILLLGKMCPDEPDEDILSIYLQMAGQVILNRMYPYMTEYDGIEVPERYTHVQIRVAVYLLNKRGAEGQIQHIENGIHRNYGDADVPDSMLRDIIPFAQAIR